MLFINPFVSAFKVPRRKSTISYYVPKHKSQSEYFIRTGNNHMAISKNELHIETEKPNVFYFYDSKIEIVRKCVSFVDKHKNWLYLEPKQHYLLHPNCS